MNHTNVEDVKRTAKYYNMQFESKTFESCKDCCIGKAKQKKLNKDPVPRSTTPGERLMFDMSLIKKQEALVERTFG